MYHDLFEEMQILLKLDPNLTTEDQEQRLEYLLDIHDDVKTRNNLTNEEIMTQNRIIKDFCESFGIEIIEINDKEFLYNIEYLDFGGIDRMIDEKYFDVFFSHYLTINPQARALYKPVAPLQENGDRMRIAVLSDCIKSWCNIMLLVPVAA